MMKSTSVFLSGKLGFQEWPGCLSDTRYGGRHPRGLVGTLPTRAPRLLASLGDNGFPEVGPAQVKNEIILGMKPQAGRTSKARRR